MKEMDEYKAAKWEDKITRNSPPPPKAELGNSGVYSIHDGHHQKVDVVYNPSHITERIPHDKAISTNKVSPREPGIK